MNRDRVLVTNWCNYKKKEFEGGIVVKVYDDLDLSTVSIDKRLVLVKERSLANLVSHQPFPTMIRAYFLDKCSSLILSDRIQLMYFRRDVLDRNDNSKVVREFQCVTGHFDDPDFWREFVHGPFFSCHEILVKKESPLRMFFDCECDVDTDLVFSVEDQEGFFARFIAEIIDVVNNMLVAWGVCTDKDSLDWIRCTASDTAQKKLSAHLYLHGSGTCFCRLSDLRVVYTICYIVMGRRCCSAREEWVKSKGSAQSADTSYYLWVSLHLNTLMDPNVYQYGHSTRCYGSMSIKNGSDVGNYKRCMLTKPEPTSFKLEELLNSLIQVPDLDKVKRLITISKFDSLEEECDAIFARLNPRSQRGAPRVKTRLLPRENIRMTEIKDAHVKEDLVLYCNRLLRERMGCDRDIFNQQDQFYLMTSGYTVFVEKSGGAFCIREKLDMKRANATKKRDRDMGYHESALVGYYFSAVGVTFKCFKCCKIEETDRDYIPIDGSASQGMKHLLELLNR